MTESRQHDLELVIHRILSNPNRKRFDVTKFIQDVKMADGVSTGTVTPEEYIAYKRPSSKAQLIRHLKFIEVTRQAHGIIEGFRTFTG